MLSHAVRGCSNHDKINHIADNGRPYLGLGGSVDCPKCHGEMKVVTHGDELRQVEVDRCSQCGGIWFDAGEAELLKDESEPESIDSGDPDVGGVYNEVRDVNCPRCQKKMATMRDPKQDHIEYEVCQQHGIFFDAGEFTAYTNEGLLEVFLSFEANAH